MRLALGVLGGLMGAAVLLLGGLAIYSRPTLLALTRVVGIQQVTIRDGEDPPIWVTIWYPTTTKPGSVFLGPFGKRVVADGVVVGRRLPLVVISHGTGGWSMGHADTALSLAQAGYVVAAPTHPGDNYRETRDVGTADWLVKRAHHIRRVDDYMLGAWKDRGHVDPKRLGFFGFSAGGTTGLIVIGGEPNLGAVTPLCKTQPEFVCKLLKPGAMRVPAASEWTHDARIKAAVIASPGFGFAFAPNGLSKVRAPVQLWLGEKDVTVPYATNAGVVRTLLQPPPEFHGVPGAAHFSFLTPCGKIAAPVICEDPEGFDRKAFHAHLNREVLAFFRRTMPIAN